MSKIVVLAEKPSVARDIARVLQCHKKLNGALEGNQYIVTWALGHLVTLADPEQYDQSYKNWDIEDLPILPDRLSLVVIKQTSKQYQAVKTQLLRKDVSSIVIATDAGREGELVARLILEKAHVKKPLKRLWISSVTDKAIKDGFKNLKNANDYYPLYQSAYSRSVADWFVGINATRALTCKYNAQLSCGRVQTPTLAMIYKRMEDIRKFVPKPFYGLQIESEGIIFNWQSNKKENHLFDESKINEIMKKIQQKPLVIKNIKSTDKQKFAPALYDLTELQRDANKLYGYSPKETLNIMQDLYEYHKVLTYPRTDSRYISDDIVPTLKERLEASLGGYHDQAIREILSKPIKKQSHFVNNQKVSDHHAIIPTEESPMLGTFNDREMKIYSLVLKRFLAVLLPPYQYIQTTIEAQIEGENFITKGKVEKQLGFKSLGRDEDDENDQSLPLFKNNQKLTIKNIYKTNGQTQPPAHFNEATLLSAMENPQQYMTSNSKNLSNTLKETGGLGTVATRADIIEKLFGTFLLEKHGQNIYVTKKGIQLLSLVPTDLREVELTAKWENQLSQIATNKKPSKQFIHEIKDYTKEIVEEIKTSNHQYKHDNLTTKKCPKCNQLMLEVNGKKGKMLVCSDRECNHRQMISMTTNARCPNCHKKLELTGTGNKQMFLCKNCGHRQSMEAFKKERETKKNNANKNDVKKYMNQQRKEQQTHVEDSPFAALLALKKDL